LAFLIHLADLTSLLWCVSWVCAALFGASFLRERTSHDRLRTVSTYVAFWISLVIAAGASWYGARLEETAYSRSIPVIGTAISGSEFHYGDFADYVLHCRFTDAKGMTHSQRMTASSKGWLSAGGAAHQHFDERAQLRYPFPVKLRYDPDWPERCWVDDGAPQERTSFVDFQLVCVVLQIIPVTVMSLMALYVFPNRVPSGLHRVVPLGIAVTCWLFFSFLDDAIRAP